MEEGQGEVQGGFVLGADSSLLLAAGKGVLGSKGGCMVESQQLAGLGSPGCPATKGNSPSKSWGDLFLNCIHLRPVPLHLPYVSPFPLGSPRKVFSVLQFCLIFSSPRGVAALRGRSSLSPSLCKIIAIAERPLVL